MARPVSRSGGAGPGTSPLAGDAAATAERGDVLQCTSGDAGRAGVVLHGRTKPRDQVARARCRYTDNDTEWTQALGSGELVAADSWNDTPLHLHKQGVPVDFMKPKEGAMTWVCGITLMSFISKDKEQRAYDLIDAYLAPSTGQYWIEHFGMGHSNAKAYRMVTAAELKMRGLPPDNIPGYIASGHFQSQIKNQAAVAKMFNEVKAGM